MVQPISQTRHCPKCLEDDVEKVGWNYWYCNGCTNIWQIIAAAGVSQQSGTPSTSKPSKKTKPETRVPEKPEPGTMEPVKGLDFPVI